MLKKKNLFDGLGLDHDYHCLEHQDLGLIGKKHKHWRKAHKGDDIGRVRYKCEGRRCVVCSPVDGHGGGRKAEPRILGSDKDGPRAVRASNKEAKAHADFPRGACGFDQRHLRIFSEAHVDGTKPADPSGHN